MNESFTRAKLFTRFPHASLAERWMVYLIWDDQGHIVTNFHVIEPALRSRGGNIRVSLQNVPEDYEAKVVGAEPEKDLAVLKIDPGDIELQPVQVSPPITAPKVRLVSMSLLTARARS